MFSNIKRFLSLILVFCLLLSCSGISVFAEEQNAETESVEEEYITDNSALEPADSETTEPLDIQESEQVEAEQISEPEPAAEEDESERNYCSTTRINPTYSNVITEDYIPDVPAEQADPSGLQSYAEDVIYSSKQDAADALREELEARSQVITICINTDDKDSSDDCWESLCDDIFNTSLKHTGVPTEGDYIYYQWGGYKASGYWEPLESGGFTYKFVYSQLYYTTAEQEEYVNYVADEIISELDLSGRLDYQKVALIYDYLCQNVKYDEDNLNDKSYVLKYTAYAALVNGEAVSRGFSNAFYLLCLSAGVDARIVKSDTMDHYWNIVQLDNVYYELDSTWDRNSTGLFSFFLKGTENWTPEHEEVGNLVNWDGSDLLSPADSVYTLSQEDSTEVYLRITSEPEDVEAAVGSDISFSVGAFSSGEEPTYLWQYQAVNSSTWYSAEAFSKDTYNKATLILDDIVASMNGAKFRCVVEESRGFRLESEAVGLTVYVPAVSDSVTVAVDEDNLTNKSVTFDVNYTLTAATAACAPILYSFYSLTEDINVYDTGSYLFFNYTYLPASATTTGNTTVGYSMLVPGVTYYVKFAIGYIKNGTQVIYTASEDEFSLTTKSGNSGFTAVSCEDSVKFSSALEIKSLVFTAPEHGLYQFINSAQNGYIKAYYSNGASAESVRLNDKYVLIELWKGQPVYLYAAGYKATSDGYDADGAVSVDYASGISLSDNYEILTDYYIPLVSNVVYSYTLSEHYDKRQVKIEFTYGTTPITDGVYMFYYPNAMGSSSWNTDLSCELERGETVLFVPYIDEDYSNIYAHITVSDVVEEDFVSASSLGTTARSAKFNINATVTQNTASNNGMLFAFYDTDNDIDVNDESTYIGRWQTSFEEPIPCTSQTFTYEMDNLLPNTTYYFRFAIGYWSGSNVVLTTEPDEDEIFAVKTSRDSGVFSVLEFNESDTLDSYSSSAYSFTAPEKGLYQFTVVSDSGYVNVYNPDSTYAKQLQVNSQCTIVELEEGQVVYFFALGYNYASGSYTPGGKVYVSSPAGEYVEDGSYVYTRNIYCYTMPEGYNRDKIIDISLVDSYGNTVTEGVSIDYFAGDSLNLYSSDRVRCALLSGETVWLVPRFDSYQGALKIKITWTEIPEETVDSIAVSVGSVTNKSANFEITSTVTQETVENGARLFMVYDVNPDVDIYCENNEYAGRWNGAYSQYCCHVPCLNEAADFEWTELLPDVSYYFRFAIGYQTDDGFVLTAVSDEVSFETGDNQEGITALTIGTSSVLSAADTLKLFSFTAPSDGVYQFTLDSSDGYTAVYNTDGNCAESFEVHSRSRLVKLESGDTVYFYACSYDAVNPGKVSVCALDGTAVTSLDPVNCNEIYKYTISGDENVIDIVLVDDKGNEVTDDVSIDYFVVTRDLWLNGSRGRCSLKNNEVLYFVPRYDQQKLGNLDIKITRSEPAYEDSITISSFTYTNKSASFDIATSVTPATAENGARLFMVYGLSYDADMFGENYNFIDSLNYDYPCVIPCDGENITFDWNELVPGVKYFFKFAIGYKTENGYILTAQSGVKSFTTDAATTGITRLTLDEPSDSIEKANTPQAFMFTVPDDGKYMFRLNAAEGGIALYSSTGELIDVFEKINNLYSVVELKEGATIYFYATSFNADDLGTVTVSALQGEWSRNRKSVTADEVYKYTLADGKKVIDIVLVDNKGNEITDDVKFESFSASDSSTDCGVRIRRYLEEGDTIYYIPKYDMNRYGVLRVQITLSEPAVADALEADVIASSITNRYAKFDIMASVTPETAEKDVKLYMVCGLNNNIDMDPDNTLFSWSGDFTAPCSAENIPFDWDGLIPNVTYYFRFAIGYKNSDGSIEYALKSKVISVRTLDNQDDITTLAAGVSAPMSGAYNQAFRFTASEEGMYRFVLDTDEGFTSVFSDSGARISALEAENGKCLILPLKDNETVYFYANSLNDVNPGSVSVALLSGTSVNHFDEADADGVYQYTLSAGPMIVDIVLCDDQNKEITDDAGLDFYIGNSCQQSRNGNRVRCVLEAGESVYFVPRYDQNVIGTLRVKISTAVPSENDVITVKGPTIVTNRTAKFSITSSVTQDSAEKDVKLFMFYDTDSSIDMNDESTYINRWEMDFSDFGVVLPCVDEEFEFTMDQLLPNKSYYFKFAIGYWTENEGIKTTAVSNVKSVITLNNTTDFTVMNYGETVEFTSEETRAFMFTATADCSCQFKVDAQDGFVNLYKADGSNYEQFYVNDRWRIADVPAGTTVYFFARGIDNGNSDGSITIGEATPEAVSDSAPVSSGMGYKYTLSQNYKYDVIIDIRLVDEKGRDVTDNVWFDFYTSDRSDSGKVILCTLSNVSTYYGNSVIFVPRYDMDRLGQLSIKVTKSIYGDLNNDGNVDVLDTGLLRRVAAGLITLNDTQKLAGDVYTDGRCNSLDVNILRRYIAEVIDHIPYIPAT